MQSIQINDITMYMGILILRILFIVSTKNLIIIKYIYTYICIYIYIYITRYKL